MNKKLRLTPRGKFVFYFALPAIAITSVFQLVGSNSHEVTKTVCVSHEQIKELINDLHTAETDKEVDTALMRIESFGGTHTPDGDNSFIWTWNCIK